MRTTRIIELLSSVIDFYEIQDQATYTKEHNPASAETLGSPPPPPAAAATAAAALGSPEAPVSPVKSPSQLLLASALIEAIPVAAEAVAARKKVAKAAEAEAADKVAKAAAEIAVVEAEAAASKADKKQLPKCRVCSTDDHQGNMTTCHVCNLSVHGMCLEPPIKSIRKTKYHVW